MNRRIPECHGIIPARYASSRFPGKPLAMILGKPMFWHVWNRASLCAALKSVTVATDDVRIFDAATALNVPVIMTGEHQSGTDRVQAAACRMGLPDDAVVVNIQGDEPALDPAMLEELVAPFALSTDVRVVTLARRISPAEAALPDRVKVVLKSSGEALYFSRAGIPYDRESQGAGHLLHIGLYAFTMEALTAFTRLAPSSLENIEKLEQLRLLENGIPIQVVLTEGECHSVDTQEDLRVVIEFLKDS